ncbi:MAG: bifunctional transaldolase/phosoglucose isomerase [Anaerolineae bacterium]
MSDNPLLKLAEFGQSIWYDNISREVLESGELQRMIEEDGVTGLTSNPTIFQKAIAGSDAYDPALRRLLRANPQASTQDLYEALSIDDIRRAADLLRPVYERTAGVDGYVSLEVSPHLAHDTAGTVEEARRLFATVDRPNLMIKVPATPAGPPALAALVGGGINVNATLMFSLAHYETIVEAYLQGLERLAEAGGDLGRVASVASFFVSRVDALVDRLLDQLGPEGDVLKGKTGIANSKQVYARFKELFGGERFRALVAKGARAQRPLWASTSTKNPEYRDVLYVEELIGPDTVNTIPPATLNAFRDHGVPRYSLADLDEAPAVLGHLAETGIDLDAATEQLQVDGVKAFADSFDQLLAALDRKRAKLLAELEGGSARPEGDFKLGPYRAAVEVRLKAWAEAEVPRRVWEKDGTVWVPDPAEAAQTPELADRLGWLTVAGAMQEKLDDLTAFADEIRGEGFTDVVLLGMGGSSLAPQVFQTVFGNAPGYPKLTVLDSTAPGAVLQVEQQLDLARTLFLVSSKSGGTIETLSLFKYFYEAVSRTGPEPGRRFVALTDPGSKLEEIAREEGFRRVFATPPDVGGRYSALTCFGLVPAALIGVDLQSVLEEALAMAQACYPETSPTENPGLALGAALGELARAGRDKVTFVISPGFAAFGAWVEQLIAESTGKHGSGILPVVGEALASPDGYGDDRVFVFIRLTSAKDREANRRLEKGLKALERAGYPLITFDLDRAAAIGGEFFRWEMAIALAGAALGINPFDQPNVESAKVKARELMAAYVERGQLPAEAPVLIEGQVEVYGGPGGDSLSERLAAFSAQARPGDYLAIMAYVTPSPEIDAALDALRRDLRDRLRLATTVGYGPRFLHSTGQLHKGDGNRGLFLQLTADFGEDAPIPGEPYSFGVLIAAQAYGDWQALTESGRRCLRLHLKGDFVEGLKQLVG